MSIDSDKRDCIQLIHSFFHFVDNHQFDKAVELFTEDAVFERPDLTAKGRDQIADIWAGRPPEVVTRHSFGPPYFLNIDESTAETVTQATLYHTVKEGDELPVAQSPTVLAEMRDSFVKTDSGWKIKHRVGTAVMKLDQ